MAEPFHDDGQAIFYHGDVREVLRQLPAESVNMCVTSPPYWSLRDYGVAPTVWGGDPEHEHAWTGITRQDERYTGKKKWQHIGEDAQAAGVKVRDLDPNAWGHPKIEDTALCECGAWVGALGLEPSPELYVAHIVEVFHEVRRVLRKDGTLWLNLDSCHSGSGRGGNPTKASSTLEGSLEHQEASKVSRSRGSQLPAGFHENARQNGAIGRSWQPPPPGFKSKDLVPIPWMVGLALQADGWWLRQDVIWSKPNPMPESMKDRCTMAHEYLLLLSKSERYWSDFSAIREPSNGIFRDQITARAARSTDKQKRAPTGKVNGIRSKKNSFARETATPMVPGAHTLQHRQDREDIAYEDSRNKRSVWTIPTSPFPEAHFATFPPALVEPCILAGCPEGGIVLDPFLGSGTTAMVARQLGRRVVGIDLKPEYLAMAMKRVGQQGALMAGGGS